MTLDDLLKNLFADGHLLERDGGVFWGDASLANYGAVTLVGVEGRTAVGIDAALALSEHVLTALEAGRSRAIFVLIDSDSQRMSKRDELLGLHEFLAHLAKCLIYSNSRGADTIGLLYGNSAAGAFIATALATRILLALPGAHPAVMDLASMARVTKLPLELLQAKSKDTPVFAPGLANLFATGGVAHVLDPSRALSNQVLELIRLDAASGQSVDRRDRVGQERGGRLKAGDIAAQVYELARARG